MFDIDSTRSHLWKAMLEEASGVRLPELDEPGWNEVLGGGDASQTGLDRTHVNEQARKYYFTDPTARHMVQLHNYYTFGRGVSIRAKDEEADKVVQAFWKSTRNRASISRVRPQWLLARDLKLDGELFLALFTSKLTGKVTLRQIPPTDISKIVYVPGDPNMPKFFVHHAVLPNGKRVEQYLPDWRVADNDGKFHNHLLWGKHTEVAVMHVLAEDFDGRGISDLVASIPWIKALKGFMEDRATLSLALATHAFRMKIKGNKNAASRMAAKFQEYETSQKAGDGDGRERRQGANTFIANEAVDYEQMQVDSKAANAYQDMRMFRQQSGIGMGVFEHYLGDPSTGNLATATAMELPMLKMFEFGQEAWGDVFSDIGEFVIRQAIRYGDLRNGAVEVDSSGTVPMWELIPDDDVDYGVDVNFPPIIERDLTKTMGALAQAKQAEQMGGHEIIPPEETAKIGLGAFGRTEGMNEILDDMKARGFKPTVQPSVPDSPQGSVNSNSDNDSDPTPDPSPQAGRGEESTDVTEGVTEADDAPTGQNRPVKLGKPLGKTAAKKRMKVNTDKLKAGLDAWKALPSLADMAKDLGMTLDELDAA